MSVDLRLPNINADTEQGQLNQLKSYLYQVVQELNWAINSLVTQNTEMVELVAESNEAIRQQNTPDKTFGEIKALIIKSADIIDSYYDTYETRFDGRYTSQSDFGAYAELTSQEIEANSEAIEQNFTLIEAVDTRVDTVDGRVTTVDGRVTTMGTQIGDIGSQVSDIDTSIRKTNAWIRTGLLEEPEEGPPIYGIEVGQKTTAGETETFHRYARFTASGIYLYLPGLTEPVAWMTGEKLYITNAQFNGGIYMGGYEISHGNGLTFKWKGRD